MTPYNVTTLEHYVMTLQNDTQHSYIQHKDIKDNVFI